MATIGIQLDSNAARVLRDWYAMPAEARGRIKANVARELIMLQGDVRSKTGLKWRSGARGLSGRLTSNVRESGSFGLDGAIGFRKTRGFPYELAQEFGAKAKPGKAMAIPLTPAARRAGSPRNMAVKLFIPHGTHVLAESRGQARIFHYALVKSIKARLGFARNVEPAGERISQAIIAGMAGRNS